MISFLLALFIGLAAGWLGFLISQSLQRHSLWSQWFSSFSSRKNESLTFIWNRSLIAWLLPCLKQQRFRGAEIIAWGFWLSLEAGLLFSLLFGFTLPSFFSGGVIGVLYPYCWRFLQKRKRRLAIQRQLPFIMDLLAVSAQAGLDMMQAIQRMVQALPPSELLDEFKKMVDDLKLGRTRKEALEDFKKRVGLFEVSHFVSLLLQAVQLGTPLSSILLSTSQHLQEKRFRRAERMGGEAAIKILFPLVFCILPSVFLLIFSPFALRWMSHGMEGFLW